MKSNEWKEDLLVNVTEIIFSGGTPSTKNEEYWSGEFKWLSSGETRNDFINDTEKTITNLGIKNSSTRLAKQNDVVIASAGQGNTRGQISFSLIDTYINQSVIALRSNSKKLNSFFLYYNLKGRYDELRHISDGNSSRGSLTTKMIKELNIKFPSLKEQKNISNILYILDSKIYINNKINEKLESTAKALYNEWFVNFNFPNEEGLPYKDNGGEFYETELGEIPVGWEAVEIGDLCEVTIGGYWGQDMEFKNSIPSICFRGTDLQHLKEYGFSNDAPIRWIKESDLNKRILEESDVLIGGSGLGPVGRSQCFVSEFNVLYEFPIIYSNFCKRIRFKNKQLAIYVEHILENLYTTREINNYVNGTSVPNLDINGLLKHKIILPTSDILLVFSKIKGKLFSNKFLGENKKLNNLKNVLIYKLMSGQIDTNDLDLNWEKLSKTLEEIE